MLETLHLVAFLAMLAVAAYGFYATKAIAIQAIIEGKGLQVALVIGIALVLLVAGLFAIGVAIFPMGMILHGVFAVSLFLCIAFVSRECTEESLKLVKDEKLRKSYRQHYKWAGGLRGENQIAQVDYKHGSVCGFSHCLP